MKFCLTYLIHTPTSQMAEMRAKFTAPGSLSAMFSTSPHIINTAPHLSLSPHKHPSWQTDSMHPHAIVGDRDLPVMLAVETLQGQGLGPGLGLVRTKGATHRNNNHNDIDFNNDNNNHITEGTAYSTLAQWPADLRGLQAMGLGLGQGLGQGGGGVGGDLLGPLHTAFPTIADLVRRHGSRPGSRQGLDQGQGLGQGHGVAFNNTVVLPNHHSNSGSNSRHGSRQGTALGYSHSRPASKQGLGLAQGYTHVSGQGLVSPTPGSSRPGTGMDTRHVISISSRPSSRPVSRQGLAQGLAHTETHTLGQGLVSSPSSHPSSRPVSRLMAMAHLVDRVTASGTAPRYPPSPCHPLFIPPFHLRTPHPPLSPLLILPLPPPPLVPFPHLIII